MKKRHLVMVMAAALTLGLTGCNGKEKDNVSDNVQKGMEIEEENTTQENTQIEADEETVVETEDSGQEAGNGPHLNFVTEYYDSGEDSKYIFGYYPMAEVTDENYPELASAVSSWFDNYKENYEAEMEKYAADAKMAAEDMGDDFSIYTLNYSAKAQRLDNRITSIAISESSYTGGAHGYDYMYGITFDTQTGKEIQFEDLGDIQSDVAEYIDEYIKQKRNEGYMFDFYEDTIAEKLANPVWYLDGIGLNFIFNAYDIGSYAEGRTIVSIPYSKMENFNPEYKMEGGAMFAELRQNEPVSVDANEDGKMETIELLSEYDENGDTKMSLKVNDVSMELDMCAYMTTAYFVRAENGRSFVLVSCDMMSDDFTTQFIEVTEGTPKKLETISGKLIGMSNDTFTVSAAIYTLGTYTAKRSYTFAEGVVKPVEERFEFKQRGCEKTEEGGLVLKAAMKVLIEQNGSMEEKELPAGTKIYPINSDGESVVGFELEDDTYGEITFERKDAIIYINGVSEFDLFESLPYAG